MIITKEVKGRILEAIRDRKKNFTSDAKMAVSLGISSSQLSRILKGEFDNVLGGANWISIARRLEVQLGSVAEIITASTPVFVFINNQLSVCQENGLSGMLCDHADIGKTHAAKHYAKINRNAVYIDCSQVKSKQKLIRQISKELGLGSAGRYNDVYEDLVFYLRSIPNPLIIIDEAGDLDYAAFLELKALWNATEGACGWYMMGADGLKAKIDSNLGRKKVGFAEIFSRYGSRYQKITPDGKEDSDDFTRSQVSMIARANGITDVQSLYARTQGSLRRIRIEIQKLKTA
jgi:DNA transposition AAA+ family ATPase